MRLPAITLALAALAALGLCAWGCTDLHTDCSLNLDCPGTMQPQCGGIFGPDECGTCVEGYCCQALADCNTDGYCLDVCLFGLWPPDPGCKMPPSAKPFAAITSCMAEFCATKCAVSDGCNPVTNAGCPGTTCDAVYPGAYACTGNYGTPAELCDACDNVSGPFCDAGLHCHPASHTCARFCCDDGDCGTGKCVTDPKMALGQPLPLTTLTAVGVCLTQDGTSAACDAPATAPSKGSCAPKF